VLFGVAFAIGAAAMPTAIAAATRAARSMIENLLLVVASKIQAVHRYGTHMP
jgi:hypothetical protein